MEAIHNNIIGRRMKIEQFEQYINPKNPLYVLRQVNIFRRQQILKWAKFNLNAYGIGHWFLSMGIDSTIWSGGPYYEANMELNNKQYY